MRKNIAFLALFFSFVTINAQNDGILWKVSGNGLEKPSYLFGTVHIHCNPASVNNPNVINAINTSSTVAFELNLGDMDVLMAMYKKSLETSSSSLKSILKPLEYKSIDSACKVLLNASLTNFDSKPMISLYSSLVFSEKFLGCKGIPIDMAILELSKKAGKPTIGLESFNFQDSLIKTIPQEVMVKCLVDFCRDLAKSKNDFMKVFAAYNSQKVNALYELLLETSPELTYLRDALLVQRNLKWTDSLKKTMASQSYFVAVGAAHLAGNDGLIALLKKAGYTVTPVKF